MPKPLVSIIIPVYNAEKHIAESITSALNQTWPNIQLIIVNDGSTDNSLSIINTFKQDNVIIIDQGNQGSSAAKQAGLDHASGDYIQYLDADDLLDKNKISEQIKELIANPDKVAAGTTLHFFNGDDPYTQNLAEEDTWFEKYLNEPLHFLINLYGGYEIEGGMVQPNSFLIPRSIAERAGPWNSTLSLDDDGEYFCRVVLQSTGIIHQQTAINYYRKYNHQKSLSGTKTQKALTSQINSIWLNHQHLLLHANTPQDVTAIHNATNRKLKALLVLNYYEAPAIRSQIQAYLEKLTPSVQPDCFRLGGPFINFISRTLGWKAAKFLQFQYSKL